MVAVLCLLASAHGENVDSRGRGGYVRGLQKGHSRKDADEVLKNSIYVQQKGQGPPEPGPGHAASTPPLRPGPGPGGYMHPPPPVPPGKGSSGGPKYDPVGPKYDPSGSSSWSGSGKGTVGGPKYDPSSSSSWSGSSKGKGKEGKSPKGKGEGKSTSESSKGHPPPPPDKLPHSSKKGSKSMDKINKSKKGAKGSKYSKSGHGPKPPHPPTIKPSGPPKPTGPPTPPPIPGECRSEFTTYVLARVPEAIAKTPERCCQFDGPTAAIITHAEPSSETPSGFEIFWQEMYQVFDWASRKAGVCFFMTGYDPTIQSGRNLSQILIQVNQVVSGISEVPSMMTTDPTPGVALMQEVRTINENPGLPSIGVFNAGYQNIVLETIITGQSPIPYVGYQTEETYGITAAQATLQLLENAPPRPLCLNARVDSVPLIGRRCAAYYTDLEAGGTNPLTGVSCSVETTAEQIYQLIVNNNANAVWSHVDCCPALAQAVSQARQQGRTILAAGCMDEDTGSGGIIDFVTKQPQTLQAYASGAWAYLPVIQELRGKDGRGAQYFPSLSSLVNTAIYNEFEVQ